MASATSFCPFWVPVLTFFQWWTVWCRSLSQINVFLPTLLWSRCCIIATIALTKTVYDWGKLRRTTQFPYAQSCRICWKTLDRAGQIRETVSNFPRHMLDKRQNNSQIQRQEKYLCNRIKDVSDWRWKYDKPHKHLKPKLGWRKCHTLFSCMFSLKKPIHNVCNKA